MPKPEPGMPTVVDIGGKPYHLRFTLRAVKALEVEQGISLLKGAHNYAELVRDPVQLAMLLSYCVTDPETGERRSQDWLLDNVEVSALLDLAPPLVYAATGQWIDVRRPNLETDLPNGIPTALPDPLTGSPAGLSEDTTSAYVNGTSGS